MEWKLPPKIKIFEAFGSIADKRIETKGDEARVFSSSRGKFYTVKYDRSKNAIMSNDNGSYWIGYLGYPSIAFLMLKGRINYNPKFAEALKGIKWKDINVEFKNNYEKTKEYVLELVENKGIDVKEFLEEIDRVLEQIRKLKIQKLGEGVKPPLAY